MDNLFKKLLQKTKASNDPLKRSFEGALFQGSDWFFQTESDGGIVTEINKSLNGKQPPGPAKSTQKITDDSGYLCEVIFVGDTYKGKGDSNNEDLLGKMISAMKLTENEFYRIEFKEELENIADLPANLENPDLATKAILDFIEKNRPKVVVSLGAIVTNILLGRREKLSSIHGQFFDKEAGKCFYSLMPLFHPDYLLINPNMKRTAWTDLQKVMERVGKI
jgi:uracil-DNA glycosylase family 4